MYAIIEESGGQRQVARATRSLSTSSTPARPRVGQAVRSTRSCVVGEVGGTAKFGKPYVAGASVKGEVVGRW